jgi:hypothetical protein
MNLKIVLWIVIGVLLVFNLFLTFSTGTVEAGSASVTASATKSVASSGMVGGC